jgi:conjugative transposon TraM protein
MPQRTFLIEHGTVLHVIPSYDLTLISPPLTDSDSPLSTNKTDWKKYAVFAGMGLLFVWAMYVIFAPSSAAKEEQNQGLGLGLNMDVPAPAGSEMVDDKRIAYEQEQVNQMQQERMKTLEDFMDMVQVDNQPENDDDLLLLDEKPEKPIAIPRAGSGVRSSSPAQSSVDAYRDMNRSLGAFYEQPKEDERVKQLTKELETLKNQLDNQPKGSAIDDQLALMEKSYEMAARYLPGTVGTAGTSASAVVSEPTTTNTGGNSGKTAVVPITGVREQIVSALPQAVSDADFVAIYSQERNIGFYSPETGDGQVIKNTIRACIHDDQTVSDGLETQSNVRIRLMEPRSAGGTVIPANTILTGRAQISERLDVSITSIEYLGRIYATEIIVYDVDGQRGIAIPPSMEVNALKEIAANAGTTAGTSITFGQNAGQQLAAEAGRGLIQGTSQYFAKKVKVMKIHLKAGHQVFLLPKED